MILGSTWSAITHRDDATLSITTELGCIKERVCWYVISGAKARSSILTLRVPRLFSADGGMTPRNQTLSDLKTIVKGLGRYH